MPRFWPIVMWFSDVEGDGFIYVPSFTHHFEDHDHLRAVKPYDTYAEAFAVAISMMQKEIQPGAIALFRPYAVEQSEMPNYGQRGLETRPKLIVRRLAVNTDGYVAANVQRSTGED